jgi:hypothetical protein
MAGMVFPNAIFPQAQFNGAATSPASGRRGASESQIISTVAGLFA